MKVIDHTVWYSTFHFSWTLSKPPQMTEKTIKKGNNDMRQCVIEDVNRMKICY